jgi:hypothetical protein
MHKYTSELRADELGTKIIELQCDLDMILYQFLSSDLGYDLRSK